MGLLILHSLPYILLPIQQPERSRSLSPLLKSLSGASHLAQSDVRVLLVVYDILKDLPARCLSKYISSLHPPTHSIPAILTLLTFPEHRGHSLCQGLCTCCPSDQNALSVDIHVSLPQLLQVFALVSSFQRPTLTTFFKAINLAMTNLMKVTQSCPILCNPMDYTLHGILQARILEWVAFPFFRGSSQYRDCTHVSHIANRFFTSWGTREAQEYWTGLAYPFSRGSSWLRIQTRVSCIAGGFFSREALKL